MVLPRNRLFSILLITVLVCLCANLIEAKKRGPGPNGVKGKHQLKLKAPARLSYDDLAASIVAAMNMSVDPCEDFYTFSCGGWIANTTIPADSGAVFKSFTTITDYNNVILKSICENVTSGKVNKFYTSCMDTAAANARGAQPVLDLIQEFDLGGVTQLARFMRAVGRLNAIGVPALFSLGADLDAMNPSTVIAQFSQGGIGLPDPSLYSDQNLTLLYEAHVAEIFQLLGFGTASEQMAKDVIAFESALANISLPGDQLLNPFSTYNKLDLDGLQKISPAIPWVEFFAGLEAPELTQINVVTPTFFGNLSIYLSTEASATTWGSYLIWQLAHAFAPALSDFFVNATFDFFAVVLEGVTEQPPRWETCISATDAAVGGLLGQLYANVAFAGESLDKAEVMIQGIEAAMKANLQVLPWMDDTTRAQALLKLSLVRNMVGYPPHPDSYEYLDIDDNYFDNTLRSAFYTVNETVASVGRPADKDAWQMTADTVNAYYDPTHNEMVFPAGILQAPFFDISRPDPMNYGGAGMVMGHELTHGFDDQGRDYNGTGYLTNWWQNQTAAEFQRRADCIIAQYSSFEVLPGVYVNGNLTQGENMADCGGVKNSFHAYSTLAGTNTSAPSIVPNFSNIQLFFISFAQGWCAVERPEHLREQVLTDVHSPSRFRVLGPLINLPDFATTFNCPVGSAMNPSDRCEIW